MAVITQSETFADYPRGVTFEQVWAALMENREQIRELKESQKESQKQLAESQKETDRQIKETSRQVGDLNNRFGEALEYVVAPNLEKKFNYYGFEFTRTFLNAKYIDENGEMITEADITLEDGDKVMIVEVKAKPKKEDISEHVDRMEKIRSYANKKGDKRKYFGAIAGMVMNEIEKKLALKTGFYVIEPSGETFNITAPGDSPREW